MLAGTSAVIMALVVSVAIPLLFIVMPSPFAFHLTVVEGVPTTSAPTVNSPPLDDNSIVFDDGVVIVIPVMPS